MAKKRGKIFVRKLNRNRNNGGAEAAADKEIHEAAEAIDQLLDCRINESDRDDAIRILDEATYAYLKRRYKTAIDLSCRAKLLAQMAGKDNKR